MLLPPKLLSQLLPQEAIVLSSPLPFAIPNYAPPLPAMHLGCLCCEPGSRWCSIAATSLEQAQKSRFLPRLVAALRLLRRHPLRSLILNQKHLTDGRLALVVAMVAVALIWLICSFLSHSYYLYWGSIDYYCKSWPRRGPPEGSVLVNETRFLPVGFFLLIRYSSPMVNSKKFDSTRLDLLHWTTPQCFQSDYHCWVGCCPCVQFFVDCVDYHRSFLLHHQLLRPRSYCFSLKTYCVC